MKFINETDLQNRRQDKTTHNDEPSMQQWRIEGQLKVGTMMIHQCYSLE